MNKIYSITLLFLELLPVSLYAQEQSLTEALEKGSPYLNMRYRYEFVDQKGLDNANASTLRTVLGYKSGEFHNTDAVLEVENITEIGERRYNDTVNGRSNYAKVADPKTTEINQAYINWKAPFKTNFKLGRQEMGINSQRFIGISPWRQNHRSMDAALITNNYFKDFELSYAFIGRVNTTSGSESPVGVLDNNNINLFNVVYDGLENTKITAYDFLMDIKDPAASSGSLSAIGSSASKTVGIRTSYSNNIDDSLNIAANLEYARQSSFGSSSTNYDVDYILIEPSVKYKNLKFLTAYEELGSDGYKSLIITLGNKHGFNGFVDKFATVPVNGLKDFYSTIEYKVKSDNKYLNDLDAIFSFHNFYSDKKSMHYGKEYDLFITKEFAKHYNIGLKAAYYKADEFDVDTAKVMLVSGLQF